MVFGAILGIAGAALGFAGQQSQSRAADRSAEAQYAYDKNVWNYNNQEADRQFNYNIMSNQVARANNENELAWRENTALNDWNYGMQIRNYDYINQQRQYAVSDLTYRNQIEINENAVATAMDLENRWWHEEMISNIYQDKETMISFGQLKETQNQIYLQGMREAYTGIAQDSEKTALKSEALNQKQRTERADAAFKSLDNMVAGLKAEGTARNTGNAGKSQAKAIQSEMAAIGRTQSQIVDTLTRSDKAYELERRGMAQNLTMSFENMRIKKNTLEENKNLSIRQADQTKNFNRDILSKQLESLGLRTIVNREKILQDRYQADIEAFSKRMIEPSLAPDLPVPYQLPRTIFLDPLPPSPPPEPIKGAGGASTATNLLSAGAGLASALSGIKW
jgi:hypothetical protein